MTATSFDAERAYDDERFSAVEVFRSDRMKVVSGYFEPGQFIPVHAPGSDVAIHVREGMGVVRDGDDEHEPVRKGISRGEFDPESGQS